MSSLGLSTTQEWVIGAGLVALAGAVIWYEVEKSKEPAGQDNNQNLCERVGQIDIPWWEALGAVVVTAGLAALPAGAYEACHYYAMPHLQTLEGTQKVGVFQGTWIQQIKADGSGVEFNCNAPVILYGNYTFDQVADLKRQYRGKEKYLIFQKSDVDYWVQLCQSVNGSLHKADAAWNDYTRRLDSVEADLAQQYGKALRDGLAFPCTETYIRSACTAAGLTKDTADQVVVTWAALATGFNQTRDANRRTVLYAQFQKAVDLAEANATSAAVLWPKLDSPPNMDPTVLAALQGDENTYLGLAIIRVNFRFKQPSATGDPYGPEPYMTDQDGRMNWILYHWYDTVRAAKATKNWPTPPTMQDFLAQGLEPGHATQAYVLSQAVLAQAQRETK